MPDKPKLWTPGDADWAASGPMHEACAIYALRVCPFLASPSGRYTSDESDGHLNPHMADERPKVFGLGYTRGFTTGVTGGSLVLLAKSWRKVTWYSHHGQIVRRQVFETTRSERRQPRNRHG